MGNKASPKEKKLVVAKYQFRKIGTKIKHFFYTRKKIVIFFAQLCTNPHKRVIKG